MATMEANDIGLRMCTWQTLHCMREEEANNLQLSATEVVRRRDLIRQFDVMSNPITPLFILFWL